MVGWKWTDLKSRTEVYRKTGATSLATLISRERILYAGRVHKMKNYRVPKQLMQNRRLVGFLAVKGQTKTWEKCLEEDLVNFELVQIGNRWKTLLSLNITALKEKVKEGVKVQEAKREEMRTITSRKRKENDPAALARVQESILHRSNSNRVKQSLESHEIMTRKNKTAVILETEYEVKSPAKVGNTTTRSGRVCKKPSWLGE